MKKIFSIIIVLILMTSLIVACTKDEPKVDKPPENNDPVVEEPKDEDTSKDEETDIAIAKIGLGTSSTSIGKSQDAADDKGPMAQVDTTFAAVAFDKDDKVVNVSINHGQTKVPHTKDFEIDGEVDLRTKVEQGPDYGMKKASQIEKEWFEQIEAFEDWMIGKTIKEITGLKVKEVDPNHLNVPDLPELTSSVTITVEGYLAAVENAYDKAVEIKAGAVELGLGAAIDVSSAKNDDGVTVTVNNTMTAAAFDKDGKVVDVRMDTAQTKVPFDKAGKLTVDPAEFEANYRTKLEQGFDYDMLKASPIKKEWFEQVEAFQEWMVGKTAKEITGLKTKKKDANHLNVPDVPELTSSVTMTVEEFLGSLKDADKNAK